MSEEVVTSVLGLKYDSPTDFYNIETFNSNFKKLEDAIENIDIVATDEDIDVVAEEKKLNIVLSELRAEDIVQSTDILNLKNELNGYVARHVIVNDSIQKSIND